MKLSRLWAPSPASLSKRVTIRPAMVTFATPRPTLPTLARCSATSPPSFWKKACIAPSLGTAPHRPQKQKPNPELIGIWLLGPLEHNYSLGLPSSISRTIWRALNSSSGRTNTRFEPSGPDLSLHRIKFSRKLEMINELHALPEF